MGRNCPCARDKSLRVMAGPKLVFARQMRKAQTATSGRLVSMGFCQ
jgi:hypothetical protein